MRVMRPWTALLLPGMFEEHLKDRRPRGYFILFLAGELKATAYLPAGTPARWLE